MCPVAPMTTTRLIAMLLPGMSLRFSCPLDRSERHRDAGARSLGAVGDLCLRIVCVPFLEPGQAGGQELPGLRHSRPAVNRDEGIAPAHPGAPDNERELLATLSHHDFGTRLPGSPGYFVPAGEPGTCPGSSFVVPPARRADRAPLTHPRDVRHQVVEGFR